MNQQATVVRHRILIVDDSDSIHAEFRKILGQNHETATAPQAIEVASVGDGSAPPQQYDVDSAYLGEQAVAMTERAMAENKRYALAFIDMRMPPGYDSIETVKRLWQVAPDIQVVLCPAYSDYSWEMLSERLDVRDRLLILRKPFYNIEIRQMASALTAKWQLAQDMEIKIAALEKAVQSGALALQRRIDAYPFKQTQNSRHSDRS